MVNVIRISYGEKQNLGNYETANYNITIEQEVVELDNIDKLVREAFKKARELVNKEKENTLRRREKEAKKFLKEVKEKEEEVTKKLGLEVGE